MRDEITFGQNRIYLAFERMGFATTYYSCVNKHVLSQWGDEIARLPMPRFISWQGARGDRRHEDALHIRVRGNRPGEAIGFSRDPSRFLWIGGTVTYFTLQLCWHMGFREIILVGVDHRFATQGPPHQLVVSDGPDLNHFDGGYFPNGSRWQLPDLDSSRRAYQLAKAVFEADGRRIVDATVGGALDVFPKVELGAILRSGG